MDADAEGTSVEDFAAFYGRVRDPVYRAVLCVTGDRDQAEEAVAEAFARAYARWPASVPPPAWLVRSRPGASPRRAGRRPAGRVGCYVQLVAVRSCRTIRQVTTADNPEGGCLPQAEFFNATRASREDRGVAPA